jgi:hypothetical protein
VASVLDKHPRELDQRQLDPRLVDRVRVVHRSRGRQSPRVKHDDHGVLLVVSALGNQDFGGVAGRRGGARESDGASGGEGMLVGRALMFERAVLELHARKRASGGPG